MGWSAESTPEVIEEPNAGDGIFMSAAVELRPGESVFYRAQRTDGSPTEPWAIEVYPSIDGTNFDAAPCASRRKEVTQLEATIEVTGPPFVKLRAVNVDPSPSDKVKVSASYKRDQVSL